MTLALAHACAADAVFLAIAFPFHVLRGYMLSGAVLLDITFQQKTVPSHDTSVRELIDVLCTLQARTIACARSSDALLLRNAGCPRESAALDAGATGSGARKFVCA